MLFGAKDEQALPYPILTINGEIIEKVSSFKYLGVHIDEKLRWDVHIRELVTNCSSLCGVLWKLSRFVPKQVLLKIYFAFVHSRYQYGIATWGASYNTFLKELQIQQNRCLKAVFSLPFLYPTSELYNTMEHNILPIGGLFTYRICMTMFKILNNFNLHHNWSFNAAVHQHLTRNAHLLQRSSFRTEIGRRRFSNIGPHLFNQLPEDIKNTQTISSFKRNLIRYIKNNIYRFIVR